jgi:hypothetical protein
MVAVDTDNGNWLWRADRLEPGPAVVFDLDGVLSDAAARQHFVKGGGRRDWKAFFEACGDDPLITEVAHLLGLLDPVIAVVLLTARPLSVQTQTIGWLLGHQLRWDLLVMRDVGDYSASHQFKQRSVEQLRRLGLVLQLAFEDDRRNVEMFRDAGVPCVYIHSGYYD